MTFSDTATISTDWDLVNEDARAWASRYAGELVQGITRTSSVLLQGVLSDYIGGTLSYRNMIAQLAPTFGSSRANLIAVTEISRSFAQGTLAGLRRSDGAINQVEWMTVRDEKVCGVCGPRAGTVMPLDGAQYPPAHTRCRCFLAPHVSE